MQLAEQRRFAPRKPDILVVGGGKGGVGKTCLTANLAVEIAQKGWRTIIVDVDLGCSNMETVLGIRAERRLDDFFHQTDGKDLERILFKTQYPNLSLIPGTTGLIEVANPKFQQKVALIRELQKLEAEVIILDLGAGTQLNTLDLFLMGEAHGITVVTPEKTSIDNAFKFIRSVLFRKISRFYQSAEVASLLKRKVTVRDFLESVRSQSAFDAKIKRQICGEVTALAEGLKPRIVVNQVQNVHEAQITANILAKSAREHLMVETEYLGHVLFDKVVPEAVNSGVPFVLSHPRLKVTRCIGEIIDKLGYC